VPANTAQEDILGVIFDSNVFPQQNLNSAQFRMTVMMGGYKRPELSQISYSDCYHIIGKTLQRHLSINASPKILVMRRYYEAIPQFHIGHKQLCDRIIAEIAKKNRNVSLIGNYIEGVSLNDCVRRAKKAVQQII
jgi:oxygen-dependent protoporphyrinogen oxidase